MWYCLFRYSLHHLLLLLFELLINRLCYSLCDIFRGRILDVTTTTYIIELTGDGQKLDAFVKALGERAILEVVRSGALGVGRGEKALRV